ncbi:MAG: hypothetical protein CMF37_14735 [Leeuwenhoekiella sp.]|jgi:hypothetical protein|nr:hypothetical protein [Leeuwenhoekiella sp.]MBQ50130.1 hypothetical protein [Leeuwenhoekiella sp.]MBQ50327.1 hypothetical protein [Leeuwenhoekiella sp.]MBQ50524.1 hypothetical protein [Leeuwenhoekiella sp.]|tara:strand:- start:1089 stop:1532 length:444 start_codon:yes stop_codon:yes gene_type:complete
MNAKVLGGLVSLYTSRDFAFYRPKDGKAITMIVWHRNAEQMLEFINIVKDAVEKNAEIPAEAMALTSRRTTLTLDAWLVDDEQYDIDIQRFWEALSEAVTPIHDILMVMEKENTARYSYYSRRMMRLFQDIGQMLEALEKVILNDYV